MKHRRFLSMLLTMVMMMSMFASIPFTASAEAAGIVIVTDWDGLQKAVKDASAGQTVRLGADITCKKNGGDRIKVDGKTITLDLSGHTLDRNRTKSDSDGHVIEIVGKSTVTITDSVGGGVIKGGYAKRGGGINVGDDATCVIEGGTITGNKATYGGGIYVHGTLTMNGGMVTKNEGTDEAGGIFCNDDSVVTLNAGVVISENEGEDCGGVFNEGGTLTMTGVKIVNNKSTEHGGGGVNNRDGAKTTMTNCTVTGNEAEDCGGGIYLNDGCELTVDGGTIANNRSTTDDGGGIYSKGTTTVKGSVAFKDNYSFASGGAIRVKDGTTTVEGGTFTNNQAGDSGGAIYVNDSTLELYGGTITGNEAMGDDGGGILLGKKGSMKVHGAPMVKDNAARDDGPDIYVRGDAKIELDAALTSGAELGVDAEKADKAFTKNFNGQNKDEQAAAYFKTREDWTILTKDGEGVVHRSNWPLLQAQIDAAPNWGTVVLDRDYKACEDDGPLFIQEMITVDRIGRTRALTIDLNGHTIDRALTKPTAGGAVIMNRGILTIKDSKGGGKITGGWADDDGGGVWSYGQLTLEGVTITGNHCVNDGGGVHCTYKLYIRGGEISNNTAGGLGGGVYNENDLEISGVEIKNNTAGQSGGGLVIGDLSEATITGGTITGNTAKYYGGGIYTDKFRSDSKGIPTLYLYGGTITGNKAGMEGGGLLYNGNTIVAVMNAPVVDGNAAPTGANILLRGGTVLGVAGLLTDGAKLDLLAQDTTKALTNGLTKNGNSLEAFTYNEGQGVAPTLKDGELFVNLDVKADVWVSDWKGLQKAIDNAKDGQIIGLANDIKANGEGRIRVGDAISVLYGMYEGNNANGGKKITLELNGHTLDRGRTSSDGDGHVIEVLGWSTLTIVDSVGTGMITGGYAKRGGGINISEYATCILKGGAIAGNRAEYGGGVYAHGTFRMEGGSVNANESEKTGGGIYVSGTEKGKLKVTGGTISGNIAHKYGGGGIFNAKSKDVTLEGAEIIGNTAEGNGAGFSNRGGGTATLTRCVIRENTATGNGGGLFNEEDCSLTLEDCAIEDNTANGQGGGVFTEGSLTVTGGAIQGNTAKGNGGGIRVWAGETTINSGEITGNTSKESGGGIYVGGATLKLYGGEITGNTASEKGGGIFEEDHDDASICIHGAPVVKENTAGQTPSNIQLAPSSPLHVDGALKDGALLHVTPGDVTGIIAGVLGDNQGEDPAKYFTPDKGRTVALDAAGQVVVVYTEWHELQKEIDAAADGATVALQRDWKGGVGDEPLTIRTGKTLTLDLNGHTLDRNKDVNDRVLGNGSVIMVENGGTLTIKDSVGTGVITGGVESNGGGILNFGTLRLEGGTITGNTGTTGGGVYNYSGKGGIADMTMTGGRIAGNSALEGGGIASEGDLKITGGEIADNTAENCGGGLYIAEGAPIISGGVISGNTSGRQGGGIYVDYDGTLNLQGGEVTGNTAVDGGGVYVGAKGTLNVAGEPVVQDNTGTRGNNIFLPTGRVLNVTDSFDGYARLDLTAQDLSNPLTKGLSDHGNYGQYLRQDDFYRKVFTYNNSESVLPVLRDGELYVDLSAEADVYVSDWSGLQKAFDDAKDGTVIALSGDVSGEGKEGLQVQPGKKVTLDLNGYTLDRGLKFSQNLSTTGHVIHVLSRATLTIRDTRGTGIITGGSAHSGTGILGNHGGGIAIQNGGTCILESGAITGNGAKWGGGVYTDGTFKMTGGTISGNTSTDSGGGIHVGSNGALTITGGTIANNESREDGGGICNSGSDDVKIANARIVNNLAQGKDYVKITGTDIDMGNVKINFGHSDPKNVYYGGAGLYNEKGGKATLTNCVISGNKGSSSGGGLYNEKKCTLTLENCTVENNTAVGSGAGVFNRGKLTVVGGSFTGNTAGDFGGGICVSDDDDASTSISGALQVCGNKGGKGNDVYLATNKKLKVAGALTDGAKLGVILESSKGIFATGFATANKGEDPKKYFTSDDGYDIVQEGDNTGLAETFVFVPTNGHPVSYKNVNSRNWMSGIPGDRTLNEINIPGTHDAGMNYPWSSLSLFEDSGTLGSGASWAKTQLRYINEQFDDGFRYVDLRLNNKYQDSHGDFVDFFSIDYKDDGENLWIVHGCDAKGGTYYAQTPDGKDTSFNQVLEWTKAFLREHPTEVIILSLRPETQWTDLWDTIWLRAKKIMRLFSTEINPSTGKPYLYMEDGVFGKDYTYYPKLKDVRGQVILRINKDRDPNNVSGMGGITSWSLGGRYKSASVGGGFEESPSEKIGHVNDFYREYGGVELPRDVATHLNLFYYVPTNVVEKTNVPGMGMVPIAIPTESARIVNAALFGDGGLCDQPGIFLGWINMIDAGTAEVAARIWRTNFYDMDYVTLTVDAGVSAADLESGLYAENGESGLGEIEIAAAPEEEKGGAETGEQKAGVYTFRLYKGTEITLPECLYTYDPAQTGRAFQSWNILSETENATHLPGETFAVMEDMTISAQWLLDGETSVDVKWQDADDADTLRADEIELEVWPDEDPEHVYTRTVTAAEGWHAVLEGNVQKVVPVWERVNAEAEGGADIEGGYRYQVGDIAEETDLAGSGLVLTMIHTPQETVAAAGAITWDDYDDRDGLRPESVTLHLMKGEEELNSATVTAENEWQYNFGELPAFEDGLPVAYSLAEDEIPNYDGIAGSDFSVTNTHMPSVKALAGGIQWEDADNQGGQRPESVTVRLLANGEEISALTVTADGASATLLDVPSDDGRSTDNGEDSGEMADEAEDEATYEDREEEVAAEPAPESKPEQEEEKDDAEDAEAAETVANNWSFRFYGVPVNDSGEKVTYSIVMDGVAGYSTRTLEEDGTWFTNTLLPRSVTIAFDRNGGTGEMESADIDPRDEYSLPECGFTAPKGMMFAGWLIGEEVAQAGESITVTEAITAVAQWQEIPEPIVITFDANGGEGEMAAAEPDENGEYILPESAFTAPEGMEFAGWKVAVEAEAADIGSIEDEDAPAIDPERVYQAGDAIAPNASVTAIAQWQEPAPPIVITFDGNGGSGEMEATTVDESGSFTLPESGFIAPEGTAFAGWKTVAGEEPDEGAWTVFNAGDVIVVSVDTTVIAQWQQIEAAEEAVEGAETVDVISVTVTLKVVNGTWEDGTREDKIIVLTGHEGDELRLTFDDMPGVGYDPDEGYGMGEWDVEPPIYVEIEGLPLDPPITEDTTYTYTYAPKEDVEVPTYMVLFDENGGTGEMENVTVEYMDGYKLPENGYTAPEGMTFAGWLVGDYTLEPGDVIIVYEDTLVMAQWQSEAAEPVAEEPVEEPPTEENPVEEETPTEETMSEESPTEESPTEETPFEETPIEEPPTEETPTEETPTEETPTEETPVEETPVEETPTEEIPVEETPIEETPIEETPVEETPIEETPVEETPIEETPTEETPVEETPAEETPVEETPSEETPVEEAPVEETPTEETPIEETPVEETLVEEPPVEETPTEETPVEVPPVEKTPTEETPVEETPVEETPVEETSTEETPAEETPVEETPTEETPVEETPVEEPESIEESVEETFEEPEPVEEPESAEESAPVQTWMVLFYENGGEGSMEGATIEDQGTYTLPENGYAAPEGASFAGWLVGDEVNQPGDTVTIGEDTVIMAQWQYDETEPVVEEPIEETPVEETIVEETPAEETPVEETSIEETSVEETPSEETPVEETPVEETPVEETPVEETPVEEPVTEEPVTEEPVTEEPIEEQPAETYVVSFDGGGGDGAMDAVEVNGGEYVLPEANYSIEGCSFDCWEISGDGIEPFTAQAGEAITVGGNMTATAIWAIDETAPEEISVELSDETVEEPITEEAPVAAGEAEGESDGLSADTGEGEAVPEESDVIVFEDEPVEEAPSEVGSVFGGAGTAAIIAAIALVLAAAGIAIVKKKKK